MSPRKEAKEARKNQILDAAMNVFVRLGFHQARMDDIVEESGLSKGTLYWYFKSKEDLFLCMCEYLYEQLFQSQKRTMGTVADPEQKIRTLITSTIEEAAMWTGMIYLYIDMWSEMDRKGEEDKLRRLAGRMLKEATGVVSECIRDGQAEGAFKDFDADLVTHILLAALDGLMFQLVIDKNMFDLEAMAGTLADVLLDGLRS